LRYDVALVNTNYSKDKHTDSHAADIELEQVRAAQAGDMAAFEVLVRRYRNDVFALSYHFVRNREEAWDISQEVFVKAYRAINHFRGDSGFKTWLLRIAANQSKDFLKKRRLNVVPFNDAIKVDIESASESPDRRLEMLELGRTIEEAVAKLPEKQRTTFILREYEDLTYQDIAKVLNCSVGTVMSRLHNARKNLQLALKRRGIIKES
jgi:RNA polymerase sigma-70 factor (ECF subfamily)